MNVFSTSARNGAGRVTRLSSYVSAACWLIVVSCTSTLLLTSHANAAPGTLDTSFGGGTGKVTTEIGSGNSSAYSVAIQADGKIVVAGTSSSSGSDDFMVARYLEDGTLDAGFGTGGVVQTDLSGAGSADFCRRMALQADGKIVAVGRTNAGTGGTNFALVRYMSDGTLDSSFGTGGIVVRDGGWSLNDYLTSVAIQADGKFIVSGYLTSSLSGGSQGGVTLRFLANGAIDTSFASGGTYSIPIGGSGHWNFDVALDASGRILVAGLGPQPNLNGYLTRLNSNGTPDSSFNGGSVVQARFPGNSYSQFYTVNVQSDGKIVVGGTWWLIPSFDNADFALARYLDDGTLDTTFGTAGTTTTDRAGKADELLEIAIDLHDRIVVAGIQKDAAGVDVFGISRYTRDGILDTTFGTGGRVLTTFGAVTGNGAYGLAVTANGRLIAAGNAGSDIAMVRYEGGPTSPEIIVTGNSTLIADGDATPAASDHTDFGFAPITGGAVARTFTIQNTGDGDLTLGAVSVSGSNATEFTMTVQPAAVVAPGGSTTFQVVFDPDAPGVLEAVLSFTTNDADEANFDFAIHGLSTGMPAPGRLVVPGHLSAGLKGWWKLEETTGSDRADSSGSGNDLTPINGPTRHAESYWSTTAGSAQFSEPAEQEMRIEDTAQTGLGFSGANARFTLAAWVKASSFATSWPAVIYKQDAAAHTGYGLALTNTGGLRLNINDNTYYDVSSDWIKTDRWHHVAVSLDASTDRAVYYVDGNLVASRSDVTVDPLPCVKPFRIGGEDNTVHYFNGQIHDAAVWDRVLTPLEVKSLASGIDMSTAYRPGNVSVAPTAWWKLNEVSSGSGAVARADSLGNVHLTDMNTSTSSGGYIDGSAAEFRRANSEHLARSDSEVSDLSGGLWSAALWIMPYDLANRQTIFEQGTSGTDFISTYIETDGSVVMRVDRAGATVVLVQTHPQVIRPNAWHHCVFLENGNNWRVYIDGRDVTASGHVNTERAANYTGSLLLAQSNVMSGSARFDGRMSDFAIWKGYPLSSVEIKALVTALPVQKAGIVSYWPLDEASGTRSDAIGTNHLTPVNTPAGVAGLVGGAADFESSSSQYLRIVNASQSGLNLTGEMTVLGWVKPESTGSIQVVASRGYSSSGYSLSYRASGVAGFDTGPGAATSSRTVVPSAWSHIAGNWDNTNRRIFFDGALEVSGSGTAPSASSSDFMLGANSAVSPGEFTDGLVDEVVIARRTLRDEEVKAFYLRGLGGIPATSFLAAQEAGGPVMSVDGAAIIGFVTPRPVETSSAPRTVTIWNISDQTLTNLAVTFGQGDVTSFTLDTSSTATSLAPGDSTTFTVAFNPQAARTLVVTVQVSSSAPVASNSFNIIVGGLGTAPVPVVSSLQPATAKPGRSLVISGSGFSSAPAGNVVWFNGVKGTVTAASGTQLTVTVPNGARHGPVMVSSFGLSAFSRTFFSPSYQGAPGFSGSSFSAATTLSGAYMANLTAGDLDGDGAVDLVTGNSTDGTLTIFRNQLDQGSLGSADAFPVNVFAPASTSGASVSTGGQPYGVTLADLDLDGRLDVLAPLSTTNTVRVWRKSNSGDIYALDAGVSFSTDSSPRSCVVADVDGDGLPDIITGHNGTSVTVLRNTSTPGSLDAGSFAPAVSFTTDGAAEVVAAGDLDGDGKPEIVAATPAGKVCIFRNQATPGVISNSSFAARIDITTGETMRGARLGDLDGDGDLDILTLDYQNNDGSELPVLRNKHIGGTLSASSFDRADDLVGNGSDRSFIEIADMDGDEKPDVAGTTGLNDAVVWRNVSSSGIAFDTRLAVTMGLQANGGVIADFDGDKKPDIAGVRDNAGQLTLVRNIHTLGTPQIAVEQPVSTALADGSGVLSLGNVDVGASSAAMTVTIRNIGSADLENLALSLSGAQMADFAVSALPATILAPGATMTFTVTFSPSSLGDRSAALQIASNVAGATNPFDLTLSGSGINGTLTTDFTSSGTVGLTTDGFTPTGSTVTPTLSYAPTPGSILTLVNNTSAYPITGTFTNLAQGQTVVLSFGGTDYRFFADYFGGTGNDLVLVLQGPGVLDYSFNLSGKVVTAVTGFSAHEIADDVVVQSDGKIVVVGNGANGSNSDFALVRYLPDGSLDLDFGNSGKVLTAIAGSSSGSASCAVIQPDGKIIVGGGAYFAATKTDFALVRYHPDGSLDTDFGTGGSVTTDLGSDTDQCRGIALQGDGKIVTAGSRWNGSRYEMALVRHQSNGMIDDSFGTNGVVIVNVNTGNDELEDVAIQNDGKIVAAGHSIQGIYADFAVVRLLTDGSLDVLFGSGGKVTTPIGTQHDFGRKLELLPDGRMIVAGAANTGSNSNFGVVRYLASGLLDSSFDGDGKVVTDLAGEYDEANALAIQHDGKILVAGRGESVTEKRNFAVVRYQVNGALDTAFNGTGIVQTPVGAHEDICLAMAVQPDGKIVSAGYSNPSVGGYADFALVRYMVETTNDVTFASATSVPLSANGFSATGRTANVTLGFAPIPGTSLRVLNNSSLQPIGGEFVNLANGQTLTLNHNGTDYAFVANYFGGDGNDLTLQWANTKLAAFGSNGSGQLGIAGPVTQANVPTQVVATAPIYQKTILSMSTGEAHSLAVCSDGTVAAWGSNANGQLGNGTTTSSPTPVAVTMGGVLSGKKVIAVAAGAQHSLALCSDGTLAAWGEGSSGQIGDNGTLDRLSPVLVSTSGVLNGKRVIAISAGATHSAALCSDGTVVCWGGNTNGELGNASNTQSNVPVAVSTGGVLLGHTVTAIACGENHTLALLLDGSVAAWGRNASGQHGNSSTAPSNVPVLVSTGGLLNGKRVVEIAAGGSSSLVRCSDGVLAAWGSNDRGQLGVNNATTSFTVPQAVLMSGVLSGKTVTRLFAGKNHAGALCSDGTLATWGEGSGGELGDNAVSDSLVPVLVNNAVLGGTDVFIQTASGASAGHSLALIGTAANAPMIVVEENDVPLTDSTTTGPGFGGLLIGSTASKSFIVRNIGTQTLSSLAASLTGAGVAHYAITQQPTAMLAPGEATMVVVAFSPTTFGAKEAVLHIANNLSGSANPFDTKLTGTGDPELYATWMTGAEVPAQAATFDAGGKEIIFSLGYAPTAGTTLMVLRNTGLGFIDGLFDSAEYGQLGQGQDVELEYNGTFYTFVANYFGSDGNDLVLQWAGTRLLAWGANTNGSLGNGGSTNSSLPVSVNVSGVLSGKRLVAATCGLRHSLALCSDGTLAAWGNNGSGQLGNGGGPTAHSNVPVLVTMSGVLLGKTPVAIAAGNDFSVALCSDGTVAAWGLNSDGQLGNDSIVNSNVPVLVDTTGVLSGKIITAIAAGSTHVLARGSDGALYAWGGNSNGQLGDNSTTSSDVPLLINGGALAGKQVRGIAAGYFHSMVTCTDGTQAAWGDNSYGMIGDGTSTASLVPVLTDTSGVLAGKTTAQQFGGQFDSVWMASDGTLAAWGRNNNAQLGISTSTPYSLTPMAVPLTGAMTGRVPVFLAGGRQHHIALLDDGTLAAWGLGSSGQLGHGATPSNAATPVAVSTTSLQAGEKVMRAYSGAGALHNISLVAKPLTLPGGPPLVSTNPATLVDKTTATLQALVNPNSLTTDARFEYGLTTSYGTQTPLQTNVGSGGSSSVSVSQSLTSLQPNTTYHYRVFATNSGGTAQGNDLTFSTLPDPPFATTGSVNINNITNSTALLPGTVNPNGRETTIYFQFGLTDQYGDSTAPQTISAGSSNVNVNASISGLNLGTTYHFRLVAQNSAGTAYGDDVVFTTTSVFAPSVGTVSASGQTINSVILEGVVNPNGLNTSAYFEYGLTTSYGSVTGNLAAGLGTNPTTVSTTIAGLQPATTYHYRLAAFNNLGTTRSADATFTTLPLPPVVETHAAAALSTTSARLNGKVNAQNGSAAVTFEWGTNGTDFPNSLAAVPSPVTGSTLTDVSVDLANLAQFTTYHFRVKAVSAGGTSTGSVLTFQPAIISGLTQQFPAAPPASNGSLTVTLTPTGLLSGWRFVGEHRWRASGDTAGGLVHGIRLIEFRPVPGYLQPSRDSVNVTSAGQMADFEYYATPSAGTGGILVVLKPDALAQAANVSDRGQWRLQGETAWRDSGSSVSALHAGSYLIECKAVSGYSTPVLVNVTVSSGQTLNSTIAYTDVFSPTGTLPVVQSFSTVSTDATKPYGYVGQIRSNSGLGTGFAVKSRVVATAAHVVFDEGSLTSVQGLQWLLQEDAGGHEPLPATPRGYYLIDGYADQRDAETRGSFSLASRQKDVAALYFINDSDAARNGFAGFLASDLTNNEFLISTAPKMLVGYPVDGIPTVDQGRMHATPAANLSFTGFALPNDRVFATTGIRSTGGNSGGPLCVQHTNGNWYPAAIYLGGATQSIVRTIDSMVINLFNLAQQSGIDDQGYTTGGATHSGYNGTVESGVGSAVINITPAGSGWRPLGSTKPFTPSGLARASLPAGEVLVEFVPVGGYQTPTTYSILVSANSTETFSISFPPSQTAQETWRQTHFGSTANSGDGADGNDFDHDGFTNVQEYTAGTNPVLSSDFFKADSPQRIGNTFSVSTAGKAGRTYVLERSSNLTSWTTVDSEGPLAVDGMVTQSDPASMGDAFFYRIRVSAP